MLHREREDREAEEGDSIVGRASITTPHNMKIEAICKMCRNQISIQRDKCANTFQYFYPVVGGSM